MVARADDIEDRRVDVRECFRRSADRRAHDAIGRHGLDASIPVAGRLAAHALSHQGHARQAAERVARHADAVQVDQSLQRSAVAPGRERVEDETQVGDPVLLRRRIVGAVESSSQYTPPLAAAASGASFSSVDTTS